MSMTMTLPSAVPWETTSSSPPPLLPTEISTASPSLNEFFSDLLRYYKQVEPPTLMQDNARITITSTMMASSPSNQKSNRRWEQPSSNSATSTPSDKSVELPGRTSGSLPMCPQRKLSREDCDPTRSPTRKSSRDIAFSPKVSPNVRKQTVQGRQGGSMHSSDHARHSGSSKTASMAPPTCPQRRPSAQRTDSICSHSTTSTMSTIGSNASVVSNASTVSHASNASTISVNTIDTFSTLSSNTSAPRQLSKEEQERINVNLKTNLHKKSQRRSSTGMNSSSCPPLIPKTQRRGSTGTTGEYTDMIFVPPVRKLSGSDSCNNSCASTAEISNDSSLASSSALTPPTPPPPPTASPPTQTFTPPPPLVPQFGHRKSSYYTPPPPLDSKSTAAKVQTSSCSATTSTASSSSTSSSSRPLFMDKVFLVHGSRD